MKKRLVIAISVVIVFCFLYTHSTNFVAGKHTVQNTGKQRYLDAVFDEVEVTTKTYLTIDNQNLKIDIYQPAGDTVTKRPLVIYMHGGAFQFGQRNSSSIVSFCENMARSGYVTASISYRLTLAGESFHCDCPIERKIETFENAVNDMRAATKFIVQNHKKYRIDTTKIILTGGSAGAETILHTCFWPNNQHNQQEQWLNNTFRYAGLVPMAGAIIDTALITETNSIPIMLFHGTCDNLVPYSTDIHHYCPDTTAGALLLHGSYSIAQRYKHLNKSYYLYTGCGVGHGLYISPISSEISRIKTFLHNAILQGQLVQNHHIVKGSQPCTDYGTYDFCNE